jgi:hypothetical protein
MLERVCQTLDSVHVDICPLQRGWINMDLNLYTICLQPRLAKDAISQTYSSIKSLIAQAMICTEKY